MESFPFVRSECMYSPHKSLTGLTDTGLNFCRDLEAIASIKSVLEGRLHGTKVARIMCQTSYQNRTLKLLKPFGKHVFSYFNPNEYHECHIMDLNIEKFMDEYRDVTPSKLTSHANYAEDWGNNLFIGCGGFCISEGERYPLEGLEYDLEEVSYANIFISCSTESKERLVSEVMSVCDSYDFVIEGEYLVWEGGGKCVICLTNVGETIGMQGKDYS